jgi:opacity protein-like surface antigen
MLNAFRCSCVQGLFLALLLSAVSGSLAVSTAHAQTSTPPTALGRQLDRMDLAIGGDYVVTKSVSGTSEDQGPVSLSASNTAGAVVQIDYTRSPLVGFQFNYTFARFTQNYTFGSSAFGPAAGLFPVQSAANEYSFGYVAHLHPVFHVQPFVAVGAGTTAFKPTVGGGEGLEGSEQARMTYYYAAGVQQDVSPHFGIRVQFRQAFYKAPDFGQNYLTIQQRTYTTEPTFGFYIKF